MVLIYYKSNYIGYYGQDWVAPCFNKQTRVKSLLFNWMMCDIEGDDRVMIMATWW
jgi:hypothetical protein